MRARRIILIALSAMASAVVACGSFSSDAVTPPSEAGAPDVSRDASALSDAPGAPEDGGADPYRGLILGAGPLAYWRLGAAPGASTVADETGNGHTLILQGGAMSGVPGVLANDPAVRFDGDGSYALLESARPFDFPDGAPFTLELWARRRPGSREQYRHLLTNVANIGTAQRHGYALYEVQGTPPRVQVEFDPPDGGTQETLNWSAPPDETWAHYAFVHNGTIIRLYVDGTLTGTRTVPGKLGARTSGFRIAGNGGNSYAGDLDEIAIYPRALATSEILAHHDAARRPP